MASSDSWYSDFVKIGYKPLKDEVICLFYLEPAIAAVFMSLSTVIVAFNALLLRRKKFKLYAEL